jgi:hypothetical protein
MMNIAVKFIWKMSLKKITNNIRRAENGLYESFIAIPINFFWKLLLKKITRYTIIAKNVLRRSGTNTPLKLNFENIQ